MARTLCFLHRVPYRSGLADQFSIAYDVYLDILDGIDRHVQSALHRDTPNWHMLNACAPCFYKLEDKTPLKFSFLATMDGNQSLKLVDNVFRVGTPRKDSRTCRTDIWLSPDEVDQFKDEVRSSKQSVASTSVEHMVNGDDDDSMLNLEGDEEPDESTICFKRWRNAGPEARTKMFALFAVTGIFTCICRHGQLLVLCDMIRSSELMKYPLAIVNKLLHVYGHDIGLGYDIACKFTKTLSRSSLGSHAKEQRMFGIVLVFHGHSHNCLCQVYWHPMYRDGVGKEDFEGCECLYSESNALACGTRLATAFHRHQAIEQFFGFWSEQKHADSGKFIFNNYKQALDIIAEGTHKLEMYAQQLKTSDDDYEDYLRQECAYLLALKAEPPELLRKVDYMAALGHLEATGTDACTSETAFKALNNPNLNNCMDEKEARKIRNAYHTLWKRYQLRKEEVIRLEDELEIVDRWLPGMPEFEEMIVELRQRDYCLALDNLERLVVQRLLELTKLGMNGIGYKLREKIGKALWAFNPPRPELSWNDIVEMVSLADFDLLRNARQDIRELPWAQRANCDAMNTYFNVKRAWEEIACLNVEISCLFTWMVDEHVDFYCAIQGCYLVDAPLAYELSVRWQYRDKIHEKVVQWLYKASKLSGFTGSLSYGRQLGRNVALVADIPPPSWAVFTIADDAADESEDESEIPGVMNEEDAGNLVDFIDNLGIRTSE
ncbi:hypothetical protein A0H81_05684 [Grifola frondosa]|uniref:CxC2-like cysteine cluster KDZ transposase-associated domain-containing protein n=1 Tax=Grifola frondosa TaxID=5627 RepID=A0A1C7MCM6_GRIFR|nr:hypothetical protein A0H81_05684 [Grifola frondosa]